MNLITNDERNEQEYKGFILKDVEKINMQMELLRKNIVEKDTWMEDKFKLFNNEASSGKSRNVKQILGEIGKKQIYKVVYVQKFSKEDRLEETAKMINNVAERDVAFAYYEKTKSKKKSAKKSKILCITHRMYLQICKGKYKDLIKDRDILIIDEYPDILETIKINLRDVEKLWGEYMEYDPNDELSHIANFLKRKLYEFKERSKREKNKVFIEHFNNDKYLYILDNIMQITKSDKKEILEKFKNLLKNECFYYNNSFNTINNEVDFVLLKNNIILDANAEFDYRYKLLDKFKLYNQEKVFNYFNTDMYIYEISTTKKSLEIYIDYYDKIVCEYIDHNCDNELTLFIADKETKEIGDLKKKLVEAGVKEENFEIDYFGNIIGSNKYREFKNIFILKTPNFNYESYVLMDLFYNKQKINYEKEIVVFQDFDIENIRKSVIAGEIYQAIKRINRNNELDSKIFLFCNEKDVIEIINRQFKGINIITQELNVKKLKNKQEIEKKTKADKLIDLLNKCLDSKIHKISKKELREQININKTYFTRLISNNEVENFMRLNNIEKTNNEIVFKV
ncbi:hypothetical protein [Tepidibacter hydrothermalis]|uniref:Uncharacterized protein n=1 Tax=Tepidibacter hydrothermalis TaxID=3036126 RepID=A0ABY8EED7_9FIRM|nr:hypothetical protein [Tepidibacter hydrothermalis]WFD11319.1 hypothetical protein P4S50_04375 [Tepidibacter hydrothermalis]